MRYTNLFTWLHELEAEIQSFSHQLQQSNFETIPIDFRVSGKIRRQRFQHKRWLADCSHHKTMRGKSITEFNREQIDIRS